MRKETEGHKPECAECQGTTVSFRGRGADAEFRICSRWKEPGHLTEDEVKQKIGEARRLFMPSGRFA